MDLTLSTITDGNGYFAFFDLDPGNYGLDAPGFDLDGTPVEAIADKATG
ncbi:MAG: hypothetical protein KJT03_01875 [Verrucomicrobiae bacterium]|nr:hypothetical protein [Verrucomicrobiae bacterium]